MGGDARSRPTDFDWIAIEGIIGAGKTTIARLLGEHLKWPVIFEHVERHPLIDAYYGDPRRFALETELVFMALRLHEAKRFESKRAVVSDFSPAKTLIFGGLQLEQPDLALVAQIDEHLWAARPRPSLTIFLDIPADECLIRLRERGRPFERGIETDFLEELRHAYMARFDTLGAKVVRMRFDGREAPDHVARETVAALASQLTVRN